MLTTSFDSLSADQRRMIAEVAQQEATDDETLYHWVKTIQEQFNKNFEDALKSVHTIRRNYQPVKLITQQAA